jgi:hypothetical protein
VAGGLIGGPVGAVIGGGIGATAGAAAEPRYYHERDFYGSYAYSPGFFYAQPFATGCGDPRHPHTCY